MHEGNSLLSKTSFQTHLLVQANLLAIYVRVHQQPRRNPWHIDGNVAHFTVQSPIQRRIRPCARTLFQKTLAFIKKYKSGCKAPI